MKKTWFDVRTIVAIGIGAAVFVILGRFASIPSGVPNTNIETSYAFLALMATIFGPIAGLFIGFVGHLLKDVSLGAPWFSWIIASGVVGFIIGLGMNYVKIHEGNFNLKKILTFNAFQIVGNLIAWGLVAPTLDIVIYAEPLDKLYLQGTVAGLSNIVTTAVLGTLLLGIYAKTRVGKGSLNRE